MKKAPLADTVAESRSHICRDTAMQTEAWWSKFYERHGTSEREWLLDADLAVEYCTTVVPASTCTAQQLLHLGCGSSLLCHRLNSTYSGSNVLHIDFCESVVGDLRSATTDSDDLVPLRPSEPLSKWSGIQYCVMDARELCLQPSVVDFVFDKGMHGRALLPSRSHLQGHTTVRVVELTKQSRAPSSAHPSTQA